MSLASRISNLFTSSTTASSSSPLDSPPPVAGAPHTPSTSSDASGSFLVPGMPVGHQQHDDFHSERPPYLHSIVAGGLGGSTGDMMMHSLDTVKTRQQAAPTVLKYSTMSDAYSTIFREEGFRRGLYGGVTPAFMGSLPGTMIFFGTYEWSKRHLLDANCPESMAYLTAGFVGDLFASIVYVPSEVLKTRLQLQGRYNNPYFKSGYNYRGTADAVKTIVRTEGPSALFHGYKATIMRDLPFSALQFAFYEEFQKWAKASCKSRDIGLALEIVTGAAAGGLAGVITCPLDVVKTRIQTQVNNPASANASLSSGSATLQSVTGKAAVVSSNNRLQTKTIQHRAISTSSPSTTPPPKPGTTTAKLNTSSIFKGLQLIYRTEGIAGWFRGVGPRMVWTSVQSGTMLVLYQTILKGMQRWFPPVGDGNVI